MRVSFLFTAALALGIISGCGESAPAAPTAPAVPPPSLAELPAPWNEADLANGASLFVKCQTCHNIAAGQPNRVGPNLHGVFDRDPASAPRYKYSRALEEFDQERWTPALVDEWLANPKTFLPGNGMFFDGLAKDEDRRDLVAWLLIETRK